MIRLGTTVKSVKHMPSSSTSTAWLVKTEGSNFEEEEQEFDAVVVCNGHFTKPNMPTIEGSEKFKGTITHSHTYRCFTIQHTVTNPKNYRPDNSSGDG